MSPEAIAVGVFSIAGVVVGVLAERIARFLGRLRSEAAVSSLMLTDITDGQGRQTSISLAEADETTQADGAEYHANIDFFNGREVPTGLRDARIELVRDDDPPIVSHPDDLTTGRPLTGGGLPPGTMTFDELGVINLPPRQFVHKELRGGFGKEEADALRDGRWRSIDFVGEFPSRPIFGILGSKTYRKTITEAKDWRL